MKIFAIINVARQVDGDMVFVKIEKAFKSNTKADDYIKSYDKSSTEMIQNSSGFSVQCSCLKSVYEIDVEE